MALWSRANCRALKMISFGLDRTYLGVGPTWPEQNQYKRPKIVTAPTRPPDLKCGHTYSNYTMILELSCKWMFHFCRASTIKIHAYSSYTIFHILMSHTKPAAEFGAAHNIKYAFVLHRCVDIHIHPKKSPTHPQKSPIYPQKSLIYRSTIRHHSSRTIHVYLSQ